MHIIRQQLGYCGKFLLKFWRKRLTEMTIVYIIMGVCGSGKTTIGRLLAYQLQCDFIDADDHHTQLSIQKMKNGFSLNDQDREEWLLKLQSIIHSYTSGKRCMVLACSALKKSYRNILRDNDNTNNLVHFIHLKGTFEVVSQRLKNRKGHYMPESLLQSQFDALEEPNSVEKKCTYFDIEDKPENIVMKIMMSLK